MLKEKLKQTNSLEVFSGIGILLFVVGCPFFLSNRYYSMTLAKTLFFFGSSVFFAIGCLILRRRLKPRVRIPLIRKNRTELYFLLFLAFAVVSCIFAMDPVDAFIGGKGRNMGLMMFLFIFLAYIFVSRFGQFQTPVAVIFGASIVVINVIAFLQFCRLDPFGLYEGTKQNVRTGFMTLLGNKDVYYSYLSMALPFSLYLIFEAKALWEKIFWYAVGFSGFIGILVCNSEGGYLCVAVSVLFFLLVKCRDRQSLLVFLRIVMLWFLACLLISCLQFNFDRSKIRIETLTQICISPFFYCVGLPVSVALYVLLLKKDPPQALCAVLRKAVLIAAAAGLAIAAGLLIYFSFINRTASLGRFLSFFRITDGSWGSGRGDIWKNLCTIYGEFPLFRKLFGAGEESIAALMEKYLPEVVANDPTYLDNAHNEYLHYLLTHGLLGLIAYVLFAVSAVKRGFKEGGRYQRAAALGAVCYLVQASVNLLQALTTPMFFVFLALTQTKDIAVPKKVKANAADGAPSDAAAGESLPGPEAAPTISVELSAEAPPVTPSEEAAPAEEGPVEETPVEEGSVEASSVEEASDETATFEEEPVEEPPVEERPLEEGPVENGSVEAAQVAP